MSKPGIDIKKTLQLLKSGDIKSLWSMYRNLLMYGLIGGGAVAVDLGLFWLIDRTTSLDPVANNVISVFFAMVFSFFMNAHFNFGTKDKILKRFLSFVAVSSVGLVISSIMLKVMIDVLDMDPVLVKTLTLPVVFGVQFLLNSFITFRNHENQPVGELAAESLL